MISHDESACPLLTPEEREQKRQQRAELNAQVDPSTGRVRSDDRAGYTKRPRSPTSGRSSPPIGRNRTSTSNLSKNDYHREEKRQRKSPSRDSRAPIPSHPEMENNRETSTRSQPRNEDVWRRLELPSRTSSVYGKNTTARAPHRDKQYPQKRRETNRPAPYGSRQSYRSQEARSWRPRSPPKNPRYTDPAPVSSRAPHLERKDPATEVPSLAISDSQRTISDQLGQLELGEINRGELPKSPVAETTEERQRRIKGKAHMTDTPTSREREPRIRTSSLSIREPSNELQALPHNVDPCSVDPELNAPAPAPIPTAPSQGPMNMAPKNLEFDLDMEFEQELDITLTEEELALVDTMVQETELLEMDAEMMDNDDLLGDDLIDEVPDENAEKIDAISQLSPAMAAINMDMQEDLPPPTWKVPPQAPKTAPVTQDVLPTDPPAHIAKGYLKKQAPKNSDAKCVKATKASKKLSQLRGRDSPRKRSTLGSVVSQKPPSKKI
ncbi:uncharacterized protein LOC130496346 [Raphanus sativus]|uniref:Uncharacterized protein LOC130496346 n=1 Tax=Raphanus sativus TaxID=3726 RepID=A0A9W3BYI3_RAPSA|nr:uncharacterized protein LOC130496346 [Raphanus sativus]